MIRAYTNDYGDGRYTGMLVMTDDAYLDLKSLSEGEQKLKEALLSQVNSSGIKPALKASDISYTVVPHNNKPNLLKILWRTIPQRRNTNVNDPNTLF